MTSDEFWDHDPLTLAELFWLGAALRSGQPESPKEKILDSKQDDEHPEPVDIPPEPTPPPQDPVDHRKEEDLPAVTDDSVPTGRSGAAGPQKKGSRTTYQATRITPLMNPRSHARALHRLIPLRPVSGRSEIDIRSTIEATAASNGKLSIRIDSPRQRNGHLIILRSDGITLAPWLKSIESIRKLAVESGAFRTITRSKDADSSAAIRFPVEGTSIEEFPEIGGEIRPGRDTLVLIIHDGIGSGFTDGLLGTWLDEQILRRDPRARIAWIHPWPEQEWRRTPQFKRLKPRRLGAPRADEIVIPVLPLERPVNLRGSTTSHESGLLSLEGWFENRKLNRVRSRAVSTSHEPAPSAPVSKSRGEDSARNRVSKYLRSTSQDAGRILALSLVFTDNGFSIDLLERLASRVLDTGTDIRHAIASAISSGFFVQKELDAPDQADRNQAEEKKMALQILDKDLREAIRELVSGEDLHECLKSWQRLQEEEPVDSRFVSLQLHEPDSGGDDLFSIVGEELSALYTQAGLPVPARAADISTKQDPKDLFSGMNFEEIEEFILRTMAVNKVYYLGPDDLRRRFPGGLPRIAENLSVQGGGGMERDLQNSMVALLLGHRMDDVLSCGKAFLQLHAQAVLHLGRQVIEGDKLEPSNLGLRQKLDELQAQEHSTEESRILEKLHALLATKGDKVSAFYYELLELLAAEFKPLLQAMKNTDRSKVETFIQTTPEELLKSALSSANNNLKKSNRYSSWALSKKIKPVFSLARRWLRLTQLKKSVELQIHGPEGMFKFQRVYDSEDSVQNLLDLEKDIFEKIYPGIVEERFNRLSLDYMSDLVGLLCTFLGLEDLEKCLGDMDGHDPVDPGPRDDPHDIVALLTFLISDLLAAHRVDVSDFERHLSKPVRERWSPLQWVGGIADQGSLVPATPLGDLREFSTWLPGEEHLDPDGRYLEDFIVQFERLFGNQFLGRGDLISDALRCPSDPDLYRKYGSETEIEAYQSVKEICNPRTLLLAPPHQVDLVLQRWEQNLLVEWDSPESDEEPVIGKLSLKDTSSGGWLDRLLKVASIYLQHSFSAGEADLLDTWRKRLVPDLSGKTEPVDDPARKTDPAELPTGTEGSMLGSWPEDHGLPEVEAWSQLPKMSDLREFRILDEEPSEVLSAELFQNVVDVIDERSWPGFWFGLSENNFMHDPEDFMHDPEVRHQTRSYITTPEFESQKSQTLVLVAAGYRHLLGTRSARDPENTSHLWKLARLARGEIAQRDGEVDLEGMMNNEGLATSVLGEKYTVRQFLHDQSWNDRHSPARIFFELLLDESESKSAYDKLFDPVECVRRASDEGNPYATIALASRWLKDDGNEKIQAWNIDVPKEIQRLTAAAESGNVEAMALLYKAARSKDRDGIPHIEGRLEWVRAAAIEGDDEAMVELCDHQLLDVGLSDWLLEEVKTRSPSAMGIVGKLLLDGDGREKDVEKGRFWLQQAGEAENILAMRILGKHLLDGDGDGDGREKDVEKGRFWLQKAAEAEDIAAMRILGKHLLDGDGFEKDVEKGRFWLQKAAEAEDNAAMRILGKHLLDGDGFEKDVEKGCFWLQKAAEAQDIEGMRILGKHLLDGDDREKDVEKGRFWLGKADDLQQSLDRAAAQEADDHHMINELEYDSATETWYDPEERMNDDIGFADDLDDDGDLEPPDDLDNESDLEFPDDLDDASDRMSDSKTVFALRKAGKIKEALELGRKCYQHNPSDEWVIRALGWSLHDAIKEAGQLNKSDLQKSLIEELLKLPVEEEDEALFKTCERWREGTPHEVERIRQQAEAGDEESMLELGERLLRGGHDLRKTGVWIQEVKDARQGFYWLRKVANARGPFSVQAMKRLAHWLLEEEVVFDRGLGDRAAEASKKEGRRWLQKAAEAENSIDDHPYLVQLQQLSEKILVPDQTSRWFFERARGQWVEARFREGTTPAREKAFEEKTPRKQIFDKLLLARSENAWNQKPHIVSSGSTKNLTDFMAGIGETRPGIEGYPEIVARVILLKSAEKIAREIGFSANRANAVTYTVSLLSHRLHGRIDLNQIWTDQGISPALEEVIRDWMPRVHESITETAIEKDKNVSEWAKKSECWDVIQNLDVSEAGHSWLQESAGPQDPEAMRILAARLILGDGLERDVEEGQKWLRKAAEASGEMVPDAPHVPSYDETLGLTALAARCATARKEGDLQQARALGQQAIERFPGEAEASLALGWVIREQLKAELQQDKIARQRVRDLFLEYAALPCIQKPGLLHSLMLRHAIRTVHENVFPSFIAYFRWWDPDSFRDEDLVPTEPFQTPSGHPAHRGGLRLRAMFALNESIDDTTPVANLEWVSGLIEKACEDHPDHRWLPYGYGSLLVRLGEPEKARALILHHMRTMRSNLSNEAYAWRTLAKTYQESDADLHLACLCRAAQCRVEDEGHLLRVYRDLETEFKRREMLPEAKWMLERNRAVSSVRGWEKSAKLFKRLLKLYSTVEAASDKAVRTIIAHHARVADEILALDSPSDAADESGQDEDNRIASHPFWREFFRVGVPQRPELEGITPTGGPDGMRKIGPTIAPKIHLRVSYSKKRVSLRLHTSSPQLLRHLFSDRPGFERKLGPSSTGAWRVSWSRGTPKHLGVTVHIDLPQKGRAWSPEDQVAETLRLYGKIKELALGQAPGGDRLQRIQGLLSQKQRALALISDDHGRNQSRYEELQSSEDNLLQEMEAVEKLISDQEELLIWAEDEVVEAEMALEEAEDHQDRLDSIEDAHDSYDLDYLDGAELPQSDAVLRIAEGLREAEGKVEATGEELREWKREHFAMSAKLQDVRGEGEALERDLSLVERTIEELKSEISNLETQLSEMDEISEENLDPVSGTDPTPVSPEEGGTGLKPEIADHPFWGEFFSRGVPMHPELEGLTPTGNMKKIGPSIGNRVQIDIDWTGNGVRLRPLSTKPENLRPLLVDREAFEKEVGVPEAWKEGTEKFLSITLLPAPKEIQKTWSTERQVTETLELYGRIKKYLQTRM